MPPRYYFDADPLRDVARKKRLALFLDFDGTLTPIRKQPSRSCLSPGIESALNAVQASGRCVVAIISGRSLDDLRQRISFRGFYCAGSHGIEISGPKLRFVHEAARSGRPAVDAIYSDIVAAASAYDGVQIEKKPYSFAIHYRSAKGREVPLLLRRLVKARLKADVDLLKRLQIVSGKKVVEVVPRVPWDKGTAAQLIMEKVGNGYLPVCVGDDMTDEPLFSAFRETGVTVRVGPSRKTIAGFYLKGQWEMGPFLGTLAEALRLPGNAPAFDGPQS